MDAEREYKTCPDCAEEVLAAARTCRYCGYRFDAADPAASAGAAPRRDSLLATLFTNWSTRAPAPPPPSELVAGWGIALGPGEEVMVLAFGHVNGHHGYLVVTDRRFAFVEHQGSRTYKRMLERPRRDLTGVECDGGRRRRLRLRGTGFEIVVAGLSREMAQRAEDAFAMASG